MSVLQRSEVQHAASSVQRPASKHSLLKSWCSVYATVFPCYKHIRYKHILGICLWLRPPSTFVCGISISSAISICFVKTSICLYEISLFLPIIHSFLCTMPPKRRVQYAEEDIKRVRMFHHALLLVESLLLARMYRVRHKNILKIDRFMTMTKTPLMAMMVLKNSHQSSHLNSQFSMILTVYSFRNEKFRRHTS